MKTEDIDKKIGMPDVDAEWEKFEREVIDKESSSNKSVIMWGLSIAASIALVAGIFLWENVFKEQNDNTLAKVEQPATPKTQEEVTTTPKTKAVSEEKIDAENNRVSEKDIASERKTASEPVQRPVGEMLTMTTPSDREGRKEDNGNKAVEEPVKQEKIFSVVEQNPSFQGGNRALEEFIKTNLRYPDLAIEYGAKGRVVMSCLIDSFGYVSDIKVAKYLRMSYDTLRLSQETMERQEQVKELITQQLGEESIRVLSQMPRWSPGKMYGKVRSVRYNVPVQFQFTDDERQTYLAQKALQTRIAGLDIVSSSADLGTNNVMRLRGNRNINDSILIVVNGTPLLDSRNNISTDWTRLTLDLYRKGQFIHGIEVFKDEEKIKQYGERGKNGVISITTTPDTLCDAYIREHPELKQSRRRVEGYVMNENNEPLADAWVGTTAGAATDSEGHFALWLPLTQKELLATCTGYKSSRQQVDHANPTLIFHLEKQISLKDVKIVPRGKKETEGEAIPIKEIRIR